MSKSDIITNVVYRVPATGSLIPKDRMPADAMIDRLTMTVIIIVYTDGVWYGPGIFCRPAKLEAAETEAARRIVLTLVR